MKIIKGSCIYFVFLVIVIGYSSCSKEKDNTDITHNIETPEIDTINILYNGIKLPITWPPHRSLSQLENGMPVPYLDNTPDTINISIGRQLFVDDFLIAKTNMKREYHYPTYHSGNPVLRANKKWEDVGTTQATFATPFSDGIWYDEEENKYKMWYMAGGGKYSIDNYGVTCYAESDDGIHWSKPSLGVIPGTNIVDTGSKRDASTIWLDKQETDPGKRYKMFLVERNPLTGHMVYTYKYSSDGIDWLETGVKSEEVGDRSTVFKNPFRKKWVFSIRRNTRVSPSELVRSREYYENADPREGVINAEANVSQFWFGPWPNEQRNPSFPSVKPAIYNFDAIAYESIMLGFFSIWQGPENDVCNRLGIPKRDEVMIGYSRDGYHWSRPDLHAFLLVNEVDGSWNYGNVQSIIGSPLIVGDSLYFYVSGRFKKNNYEHASTGLATLRRDGFISIDAPVGKTGYLTTRKLKFDGEYLFVNASIEGQLTVEIMDAEGNVIPGYSSTECITFHGNKTQTRIKWKSKKDLSEIKNQIIKIKFTITNGALYSFWISPWETGESEGYTGGGGPGLSPSGKDIP